MIKTGDTVRIISDEWSGGTISMRRMIGKEFKVHEHGLDYVRIEGYLWDRRDLKKINPEPINFDPDELVL